MERFTSIKDIIAFLYEQGYAWDGKDFVGEDWRMDNDGWRKTKLENFQDHYHGSIEAKLYNIKKNKYEHVWLEVKIDDFKLRKEKGDYLIVEKNYKTQWIKHLCEKNKDYAEYYLQKIEQDKERVENAHTRKMAILKAELDKINKEISLEETDYQEKLAKLQEKKNLISGKQSEVEIPVK